MMLSILSIILSISLSNPTANEIKELRTLFYVAAEDSDSSTILFEQLESVNDKSAAILIGYKGMSHLLEAKHSYNIYTKFAYFIDGTDFLDDAIKKDPTNRELRFFRYSVQDNAPRFLGYYENLAEDKKIATQNINTEPDQDLKAKIKEYFKL